MSTNLNREGQCFSRMLELKRTEKSPLKFFGKILIRTNLLMSAAVWFIYKQVNTSSAPQSSRNQWRAILRGRPRHIW